MGSRRRLGARGGSGWGAGRSDRDHERTSLGQERHSHIAGSGTTDMYGFASESEATSESEAASKSEAEAESEAEAAPRTTSSARTDFMTEYQFSASQWTGWNLPRHQMFTAAEQRWLGESRQRGGQGKLRHAVNLAA